MTTDQVPWRGSRAAASSLDAGEPDPEGRIPALATYPSFLPPRTPAKTQRWPKERREKYRQLYKENRAGGRAAAALALAAQHVFQRARLRGLPGSGWRIGGRGGGGAVLPESAGAGSRWGKVAEDLVGAGRRQRINGLWVWPSIAATPQVVAPRLA